VEGFLTDVYKQDSGRWQEGYPERHAATYIFRELKWLLRSQRGIYKMTDNKVLHCNWYPWRRSNLNFEPFTACNPLSVFLINYLLRHEMNFKPVSGSAYLRSESTQAIGI